MCNVIPLLLLPLPLLLYIFDLFNAIQNTHVYSLYVWFIIGVYSVCRLMFSVNLSLHVKIISYVYWAADCPRIFPSFSVHCNDFRHQNWKRQPYRYVRAEKKFRLEFRRKFTTTFFSLDSPLNGNTPMRCQYEKKKNQTLWFVAQNHSNNNQMKSHNQDIAFVCACRSRQNHIFDWNFEGEWILLYFFRLSHFVFRSLSFYLAWFDHLHFQTKLNPSLLQTCTAESHTFIYNQLSIGSRCVHTRNKKFNSSSITSHIQSN